MAGIICFITFVVKKFGIKIMQTQKAGLSIWLEYKRLPSAALYLTPTYYAGRPILPDLLPYFIQPSSAHARRDPSRRRARRVYPSSTDAPQAPCRNELPVRPQTTPDGSNGL